MDTPRGLVDGCAPYKRGGNVGLFGGNGVGKTVFIIELISNIAKAHSSILLFIDNIFRFVQAGSEVSVLLGRLTSAVGYQPTLATEMGSFQERITSTRNGSITSIQAVYVPADDMTDPAPATTFIHLDATTVLARSLAAKGGMRAPPFAGFILALTVTFVGKSAAHPSS